MSFDFKKYITEGKLTEDIPVEEMENFAEGRGEGAEKIADSAKEKGGNSMLTYHHFKVKAFHEGMGKIEVLGELLIENK